MARRTQAMAHTSTKRERLEVRISPEQKELLQYAAALQGRSLSDFVTESVQRAVEEAVREHAVITLTARDSATFAEAILNPPVPSEQLRAAAADYLREVEER